MTDTKRPSYPVDSISILFLSLMRKEHTNSFRFSMTLDAPIDPQLLQQAADSLWRRMPSMVACLKPGFFSFRQEQAACPPRVQPDPGLLRPMSRQEIETCAFRIYYRENTVSLEIFHVLSDGNGAITALVTLISEYLQYRLGVHIPEAPGRLDVSHAPDPQETEDAFLALADAKPWHLPSRFSYLPPRPADTDWRTRCASLTLDSARIREAAHAHGVTVNSLLGAVLASSVMELQLRETGKSRKPVRIMIPANLRPFFGSRTLRNFSLYALPAMEPGEEKLPLTELCQRFQGQIKSHFSRETLASMSSYNVRTQNAWYFRMLPWRWKAALMRLGYRFFGESNSSLTLTNLGLIRLPEELAPHVRDLQLYMTPRAGVPYGCAVLSYGDKLTLNLSKFTDDTQLEELFFGALKNL